MSAAPRSTGALGGIAGVVIASVEPAMTEDEREANARLIAAAPELLEALRPFVNAVEYGDVRRAWLAALHPHEQATLHEAFTAARAAIAMAEGK